MGSQIHPGDLLAQGKYRVERVLGAGGMGVVVRATHLAFGDPVAIKFLLPEVATDPDAVQRFLREGRASRKIQSEHVVQVVDVGTLETGMPYLVMEYLEGEDLGARLQRTGPMQPSEAVELLLQACEAIAEAHVIGIVHRDLKPANLFVVQRRSGAPFVKVLDFGISKVSAAAGGTSAGLTGTSFAMGSPLYMSPEQLNSARDVDARGDIWSLGVILYELLSCAHPFVADDLPRLCVQILGHPPVSLRTRRPDVPAQLVAVVDRCLEKDRTARFPSVADFATALAPFCNECAQLSVRTITALVDSKAAQSTPRTSTPDGSLPSTPPIASARTAVPARSSIQEVTSTGVALLSAAPGGRSRKTALRRIGAGTGLVILGLLAGGVIVALGREKSAAPPLAPASVAPPVAVTPETSFRAAAPVQLAPLATVDLPAVASAPAGEPTPPARAPAVATVPAPTSVPRPAPASRTTTKPAAVGPSPAKPSPATRPSAPAPSAGIPDDAL